MDSNPILSSDVKKYQQAMLFHEYGLYPDEEASLWVADLGQASKEGFIVDGVIPHRLTSKLNQ